jgi:hypothetical protein
VEKVADLAFSVTDPEIEELLHPREPQGQPFSCHYSQEEDFFLRLPKPFEVPSMNVYHPFDNPVPGDDYLKALRGVLQTLTPRLPAVFADLSWRFDPNDILRPSFVQKLESNGQIFFYLLRIDLNFRGRYSQILKPSSNDRTPAWRSDCLFLESYLFPAVELRQSDKEWSVDIKRLFGKTWKGEVGRGYLRQGVWIDQDISKFLSFVVLGPKSKIHPHYPLVCRLNTLALRVPDLNPQARVEACDDLAQAWEFFSPWAGEIEDHLFHTRFHKESPLFLQVCAQVPTPLGRRFHNFQVAGYLDSTGQKEFRYLKV